MFTIIGLFKIKNINIKSVIFQFLLVFLSMLSITGGYHRLWCHNSYDASPILELFYLFFGTMAAEDSTINWCRDHRTHHRNEEQPGDPYNINKGLFHAHVGWILVPPDDKEKEEISKTDISDLEKNPLL